MVAIGREAHAAWIHSYPAAFSILREGAVEMTDFEQKLDEWLQGQLAQANARRRELLEKGLGHGTMVFLRTIWCPAVRNFDHLHAEWEVRDFHNGYRYVDLAYRPKV